MEANEEEKEYVVVSDDCSSSGFKHVEKIDK